MCIRDRAKTPGTEVCRCSSTTAPPVTLSKTTPAPLESSFSGINPTESSSVSQGTKRAEPRSGRRVAGSTSLMRCV